MDEKLLQELSQNVAALLLSDKSKAENIKKLENRIEKLENSNTQGLIMNERIMLKLDSLTSDMSSVKSFIEEQKERPEKDRREFIKQVIGTIVSLGLGALFGWLSSKK